MYLNGTFPVLVAVGAVPVVLLALGGVDAWAAAVGWLALCVVLALADAAIAADPRALRVERSLPPRALLGERVEATLRLRSAGARRVR
ncbi:DUF58 domain-containing protein, partial [Microbacterium ulmi]|nr:DUF58 domain-containing protein [Microbacterium ulmi]